MAHIEFAEGKDGRYKTKNYNTGHNHSVEPEIEKRSSWFFLDLNTYKLSSLLRTLDQSSSDPGH